MKKLKINVSKNPMNDAIVNYKSVGIKKKLFSKLFGEKAKVAIIVPGNYVKSIEISNAKSEEFENGTREAQ